MTVDISAEVTGAWPKTESLLIADADANYEASKARAIARAKHDVYGATTVPAEADLPEDVAYWVADKAVVYLVPLARDWYMNKTRLSDSKENANFSYHDTVSKLDKLKAELGAKCDAELEDVQSSAATSDDAVEYDTPDVSHEGNLYDAQERARRRGLP